MTNEEVEPYWNKKVQVLVGKTIKKVNYMSKKECKKMGWDKQGLEIFFTDGSSMLLSQDDEGNGPGSAFTSIKSLETIPTI